MARFDIKRLDGRSSAQVVVDLTHEATPGTVFAYDAIKDALERGTSTIYPRARVQDAVRRANIRLLKQHKRVLHVVPTVGYRMAAASDHSMIATTHETKADKQIRSAFRVLDNVRWDELSPIQRQLHQAHLLITGAVIQQVRGLAQRQQKTEDAIRRLIERIEPLEH